MSVLFKRFICILFLLAVILSFFLSGCKTNIIQTNAYISTPKHAGTPVVTFVPSEEPVTVAPATEIPCTAVPAVIPNGKTVYLTYDDGPCHFTTQLLDMLDEYNIKATFFTVGFEVERHPEIVRDAASRGHLIACHTYSHDYKAIYSSADAFMADVHKWEEAVKNVLGTLPEKRCLRFPGGSTNSYLNKNTLREIIGALTTAGYNWYDWNIADNDKWLAGNTEKLPLEEYYRESYLKTLGWAEKGDKPLICIAHDTCPESIEFQRFIIEDLIQKGYSFASLESCPD